MRSESHEVLLQISYQPLSNRFGPIHDTMATFCSTFEGQDVAETLNQIFGFLRESPTSIFTVNHRFVAQIFGFLHESPTSIFTVNHRFVAQIFGFLRESPTSIFTESHCEFVFWPHLVLHQQRMMLLKYRIPTSLILLLYICDIQ